MLGSVELCSGTFEVKLAHMPLAPLLEKGGNKMTDDFEPE